MERRTYQAHAVLTSFLTIFVLRLALRRSSSPELPIFYFTVQLLTQNTPDL